MLVTGASASIGKAMASYLAQHGYRVYGGARRTDNMVALTSYGITPIALDVTKEDSVVACVNQIFAAEGGIDILVNNAGFGLEGTIEDLPMQDARCQLEVNVFGAMRLAQLVLPKMRENRYREIAAVQVLSNRNVAVHLKGSGR